MSSLIFYLNIFHLFFKLTIYVCNNRKLLREARIIIEATDQPMKEATQTIPLQRRCHAIG